MIRSNLEFFENHVQLVSSPFNNKMTAQSYAAQLVSGMAVVRWLLLY